MVSHQRPLATRHPFTHPEMKLILQDILRLPSDKCISVTFCGVHTLQDLQELSTDDICSMEVSKACMRDILKFQLWSVEHVSSTYTFKAYFEWKIDPTSNKQRSELSTDLRCKLGEINVPRDKHYVEAVKVYLDE